MRRFIIIWLVLFCFSATAQKFEAGFVYSPAMMSRLTFDKDYIIFDDFTSLTAGDNKIHPYFSFLSTGAFFRYRMCHIYYQAEIDLFENKFRRSIPDWKENSERYFTYSAIEVPLMAGYTINPGGMMKFRLFAGVNNRIGRFRTVFFSTFTYAINDEKNYEYYSALPKKIELMNRFSLYYLDVMGGMGISVYGFSLDLRVEKNITNLNRNMLVNSANYKDLMIIRLCANAVINMKKKK
jgi:hypothetical protein